jgi:hypothetical protein
MTITWMPCWRRPDEGFWETGGGRQHFVHSKVMALVAFDRAAKELKAQALDELRFARRKTLPVVPRKPPVARLGVRTMWGSYWWNALGCIGLFSFDAGVDCDNFNQRALIGGEGASAFLLTDVDWNTSRTGIVEFVDVFLGPP